MKKAILLLYICIACLATHAAGPGEIRWANEARDTTLITKILVEAKQLPNPSPTRLVVHIAQQLEGTPYAGGTLEGEPEMLTVNLGELDCTTFMETVAAMAMTVMENRDSWQDFVYNLENIRYRGGQVDGYASRLHYISDWIVDNTHRGNIREITDRLKGAGAEVKTLDYMSAHRDAYPALKDSAEYARIKNVELGYRSHRFPYLKSSSLMGKGAASVLTEGDIVALTTKTAGLDVSHIGIIVMKNGVPHLLHASSKAGKVTVDPLTLSDYLKKNHTVTGLRVIRLTSH